MLDFTNLSDTTASMQRQERHHTPDACGQQCGTGQLTGRQQTTAGVDGITAETLKEHYATVSTDPLYVAPTRKQLATHTNTPPEYVSEWEVFHMLASANRQSLDFTDYQRGSCGWQRLYSAI